MPSQEPTQDEINEFVGLAHGDLPELREMLVANPALLNRRAIWNETAIEAATQMGRKDIAEYLLEQGASLDFFTAAMLGLEDRVAEFLMADPHLARATGVHGLPALYFPATRGQVVVAEMLVAAGADVNAGENVGTALCAAVTFGQLRMVEWLLDRGASVNIGGIEGKTPLAIALESGQGAIVNLLRQHEAVK